jgi:hypothetical protein
MIAEFPHKAPKGYSYEFEQYNTRTVRIMLCHHAQYDYNLGKSVSTVWGFYSSKKRVYYSPINSTSIGKEVNIHNTTPYTAMQIKRTPLEEFFV